jgi:hypothetical protein
MKGKQMALHAMVLLVVVAPDRISVPEVWRLNGSAFAGLTIGKSTDGEAKKRFATEKGAIRPEALRFTKAATSDPTIHALLDGRGAKAVIQGFWLDYWSKAISESDFVTQSHQEPESRFMSTRHEDWKWLHWSEKGVAAVVLNGWVVGVLLADPNRIRRQLQYLSTTLTPVVAVPDPGANWDRVATFGSVDVDVDRTRYRSVLSFGSGSFEEYSQRCVTSIGPYKSFRHIQSSEGEVKVTVSIREVTEEVEEEDPKTKRKRKRDQYCYASISVTARAIIPSPYGWIQRTGESSCRQTSTSYNRSVYETIDDAIENMRDRIVYAAQNAAPPSRESFRTANVDQILYATTRG